MICDNIQCNVCRKEVGVFSESPNSSPVQSPGFTIIRTYPEGFHVTLNSSVAIAHLDTSRESQAKQQLAWRIALTSTAKVSVNVGLTLFSSF